jgi:hypothetical protein
MARFTIDSNKDYFDITGWRCAIEDLLDFYFPMFGDVLLKFEFDWKVFGRQYTKIGNHIPSSDTIHVIKVMVNGNDRGNYEVLKTMLHELRHVWQHLNGNTEGTNKYKGDKYWNHPKEVDARNFAAENVDEAYNLVKEYLQ